MTLLDESDLWIDNAKLDNQATNLVSEEEAYHSLWGGFAGIVIRSTSRLLRERFATTNCDDRLSGIKVVKTTRLTHP